ncbi:MAG: homocysteine biosynthesis protein, partial [Promethearchaeota archaeon]
MVKKTYFEINEKIKHGDAIVVTAEEMIDIVQEKGEEVAAKEIDVVTTGTFGA